MNGAYYNEHDPFAAAWLRALIARGLIAAGEVDERDVQLVQPDDLRGFTQCHFFAGIGGWSLALRLAGWPDDRPVWTGSCPCQPFSSAGKGEGFNDPRHLWPAWFRLIRECHPPVVFGEQVASKAGLRWVDLVATDLEATDYAFGAADLCAAGVKAPHIRQRLLFVADDAIARRSAQPERPAGAHRRAAAEPGRLRDAGAVADADGLRERTGRRGEPRGLGHATGGGRTGRDRTVQPQQGPGPGREGGPWDDLVWIPCRDGKARPTKPSLFPLAHGVPNRVGTLRGAGNAIVPQVAAKFIAAWCEVSA